jgi:Ca2+/Na+ antiporter
MPIPDFRSLCYYAVAISDRTKLSKALLGVILLGVARSLPESVTTITLVGLYFLR